VVELLGRRGEIYGPHVFYFAIWVDGDEVSAELLAT
jgi:hypothetical protein